MGVFEQGEEIQKRSECINFEKKYVRKVVFVRFFDVPSVINSHPAICLNAFEREYEGELSKNTKKV